MDEKVIPAGSRKRLFILMGVAAILGALLSAILLFGGNKYISHAVTLVDAYRGDAAAQLSIGRAYLRGDDVVTKDTAEAMKWMTRSIENGSDEALRLMVVIHQTGDQVPKNEKEAFKWMQFAVAEKREWADEFIGWAYYKGLGVERDCREAQKYYLRAYERGSNKAAANIFDTFYNPECGISDNDGLSKWAHILAEQGNQEIYSMLGIIYAEGKGVVKNEAEAMRWFRKSVDAKIPDGFFNLSRAYAAGVNGEYNLDEAARLAIAAYAAGVQEAMDLIIFVAGRYQDEEQTEKSVNLLKYAARNGSVKAQKYLGLVPSQ